MKSIEILNSLFNKPIIQKGGNNGENSALLKLIIVIIILFIAYTNYEN